MTTYAWIDEITNEVKALTKEQSEKYLNVIINYELPTKIKKLLYWNGSKVVKKTQQMIDEEKQKEKEKDWQYLLINSSSFSDFQNKIEQLTNTK